MTPRLQKAIEFFKELHKDQKRRDGVRPYFVHLEDVACRVAALTTDEDLIIAAFGHDSKEDQDVDIERLTELFGPRAVSFILELTDVFIKKDYPHLNRKARKQLERMRYWDMSEEARLIKCCDISSNLSDLDEKDAGFSRMFLREKALCLPYLWEAASVNCTLLKAWQKTEDILKEQSKRFDLRETPAILNPCPTTLN